jgi:nascent polypeptide-associated complex subunit alpha
MSPGPVVEAEPAAFSTTEEVKSTVEETLQKKPPQVFFCLCL